MSKRTVLATPRSLALDVLSRVFRDEAYGAAALDAELQRNTQLVERDRALATELVYGSLRFYRVLLQRIRPLLSKPFEKLDLAVQVALLLGTYQQLFMRVPSFAAVNETVEWVKVKRGSVLGGYVNGVLRHLARELEQAPGPRREEAILQVFPRWAFKLFCQSLHEDGATSFAQSLLRVPTTDVRIHEGTASDWIASLQKLVPNAEISESPYSTQCLHVRRLGGFHALEPFFRGQLAVQESGSQWIALLLPMTKNARVLDACAGRGNKTSMLTHRAASLQAEVHAADLYPEKLEQLKAQCVRQKTSGHLHETYAVDWTVGCGDVPQAHYDTVLLDAPCTGLGTIHRRPELLIRRKLEDVDRLAALQRRILHHVASVVRPGGYLLYSVCSIVRAENEDVIDSFLKEHSEFEQIEFQEPIAAVLAVTGPSVRLLPYVHSTDGYFLALMRRKM